MKWKYGRSHTAEHAGSIPALSTILNQGGAIGSAAVSKTEGCGFDPHPWCQLQMIWNPSIHGAQCPTSASIAQLVEQPVEARWSLVRFQFDAPLSFVTSMMVEHGSCPRPVSGREPLWEGEQPVTLSAAGSTPVTVASLWDHSSFGRARGF